MKDTQGEQKGQQARIPLVSDLLHCIAMTVIVFLRFSFGFVYLGPKSVFFALSWAFLLFSAYAWLEPGRWQQFGPICVFGVAAIGLYFTHLLIAFKSQAYRKGEHDQFSGNSLLYQFLRRGGRFSSEGLEMKTHLWAEPAWGLAISFIFRLLGARPLATWLQIAAFCLLLKELQNYWSELRRGKILQDVAKDAEERFGNPESNVKSEPPKATRTAKVNRRMTATVTENVEERRFAELLRLLPPYSLEQAETNFKTLIKDTHSDTHQDDGDADLRSSEIIEAIKYFRKRFE